MNQNLLIHEATYKKRSFASLIHRDRLQAICKMFDKYIPVSEISWADFGCSNGFILEEVVRSNRFKFSKIVGYDHEESLLELARAKKIPNAEFKYFDMNEVLDNVAERYDLVTCFETLEHVGKIENAFITLFNHLDTNGLMIITVPNETGFTGLIKFLGRLVVRRNPYHDFFSNQSPYRYMKCLLRNDFIDGFRKPDQPAYGPHLGFDYRKLEEYIREKYLRSKELELIEKLFTVLKMNVVYVFRKR